MLRALRLALVIALAYFCGVITPSLLAGSNEPVVYGQIKATSEDMDLGNFPIHFGGESRYADIQPRIEVFVPFTNGNDYLRGWLKHYNGAFIEITFRHNPPTKTPSN